MSVKEGFVVRKKKKKRRDVPRAELKRTMRRRKDLRGLPKMVRAKQTKNLKQDLLEESGQFQKIKNLT